jgi:hypothetical protein
LPLLRSVQRSPSCRGQSAIRVSLASGFRLSPIVPKRSGNPNALTMTGWLI